MQLVALNPLQFRNALSEISRDFSQYGALELEWAKPARDKTKRQLGFYWKSLASQIGKWWREFGNEDNDRQIHEMLYQIIWATNPRLSYTVYGFDNKPTKVQWRMSSDGITAEIMSEILQTTFDVIDNNPIFESLILTPDTRYSWIYSIDPKLVAFSRAATLPERDNDYLAHIRKQACICCGVTHQSEAHHLKLKGYGGIGLKTPDWTAVPVCHACHMGIAHGFDKGRLEFEKQLEWITKQMDIGDFLRTCYLRFKNKYGEKA